MSLFFHRNQEGIVIDYLIKEVELEEVYRLRHEVMWPNKSLDYIKIANDEDGIHLGLLINEDLVSVISLFISNDEAQFRKFATKLSKQNKGYGSTLLNYSFNYLKDCGVKRVFCNARVDKSSFYSKFSMILTNEKFIKSDQEYVIMEKYL